MAAAFFALCALLGLLGLWLICPRDVPRIAGTCALIVTLVALGAALLH